LTRVIDKRLSLHKHVASQQQQVAALRSEISQLQALANIGTATCMIGHEINNLLAPVASYAALALNNPDDKLLMEKALQKAVRNSRRASRIMQSMVGLANGEDQEKKESRLIVLLEEVFGCLGRDFAKDRITVKIEIPEELTVWAVPVQIQQVLMNLILNARDAVLPGGGILTIEAQETCKGTRIRLSDTGRGIEPGDLQRIFEPFFTTKAGTNSAGQNPASGLGLAFCKRIVDAHGGSISVESEPEHGSRFVVMLPKRQSR
jgi:two-component system NtrC family sensor kinase